MKFVSEARMEKKSASFRSLLSELSPLPGHELGGIAGRAMIGVPAKLLVEVDWGQPSIVNAFFFHPRNSLLASHY